MKNILVQIKNEWRASLFLFIELLLVFVVLWYIVDWTLVTVRVYHAPMGFDTEHCYNISVSKLSSKSAIYNPSLTTDDDMQHLIELTERLRHRPGVEAVALSQNCFPYNDGSNGLNVSVDSVSLNTHLLWVEPDFFRVFRYSASDEETLSQMAAAIRDNHLVVSSNLFADYPELHLDDAASLQNRELRLPSLGSDVRVRIGAVGTPVRWSHFDTSSEWGGSFAALYLDLERLKQYADARYITLSLRVHPDADHEFMEKLMDDADRLYQVGNLYLLDVTTFSNLREMCEREDMNEAKTQLCVLGFLLLNIFLGVIGTFWFRTQQRRKEVALRMAMGSSRRGVFFRLMGEGLLLLSAAAVPALLIAFNVGIAELVDISKMQFTFERFLIAAVFTWLLMALMIVVGIWYPAYKAMKLQPAEALHDE
ncbi:MAG: FtsX-like permease family protein [Bacteroides oleiciplenus]|nr:FtsX-like permease family protein [Bacteroides oleiciplenus]